MGELGRFVEAESAIIKSAIQAADRDSVRTSLMASIEDRGISSFQALLKKDFERSVDVLFDHGGLDALFRVRKDSAQFFLAAAETLLHELGVWANSSATLKHRRQSLLARLQVVVDDPGEELMERWRLGSLLKRS